jgi:hypothetical protein
MRLLILTITALSVLVGVSLASAPTRAQVTLPPSAVVVDDNDPNFAKFGPPQWWYTAVGTPFNYYGGAMTWTGNVRSGAPVNYARWSLPLTATLPMTYEVFAFIPRYNATTTNARYQVVVSGVTTTVAISQNRYHAEWVSLGTYLFGPSGRTSCSSPMSPARHRIVGGWASTRSLLCPGRRSRPCRPWLSCR